MEAWPKSKTTSTNGFERDTSLQKEKAFNEIYVQLTKVVRIIKFKVTVSSGGLLSRGTKEIEFDDYQEATRHGPVTVEMDGHNLDPGEKGALTFHGLRHAFARELYAEKIEAGFSIEVALQKVAETLGHNRSRVSLIYVLE